MTNEQRAENLIAELGFDFGRISKDYIISLLEEEISNYQEGSSEYIRLLCGYLFCLGDVSDVPLLKKAKYGINMDVGCMIDEEWIASLENGGAAIGNFRSRDQIIDSFVYYYQNFDSEDYDDF